MIVPGASSLPETGGRDDQVGLPDPEELRVALRPPELPLPAPRTPLELAQRVSDLTHAERYREAVALAATPLPDGGSSSPAADHAVLASARLAALARVGTDEEVAAAVGDLLRAQRRAGYAAQAAATAQVLLERGVLREPADGGARSGGSLSDGSRAGRRRAAPATVTPELLAVVRELDVPHRRARGAVGPASADLAGPAGPAATATDPRRRIRVLRAALDALPAARADLLGAPEPLLRLRLAQALEAAGLTDSATTAALDALELLEEVDADPEAEASRRADPHRVRIAAHAVLARTLRASHPLAAVRHALDALGVMRRVEDAPLRVGLVTDLLEALTAAGLERDASFAAGRLASLQRSLRRDELRTGPLLAVAGQRIRVGRADEAREALEEVRRIAREHRDRSTDLEAARLLATLYEREGDLRGSLLQLRRVAADARWLSDDLATPAPRRGPFLRIELEALALVLRRAMDLGETPTARAAARAIERRTRPDGGRLLLPSALLWDHRVDARVGELVAVAAAEPDAEELPELLDGAREVIGLAPGGHEERALYWRAYLDEQHALLLERRGEREAALAAALQAQAQWRNQDAEADDLERIDALVARLSAEA
ncbi:hypothetical protein NLU66_01475 [Brachybacterium sp. NBEC-018]|uniref:hypothetical protein n=1 Tax=Brachybacterium sp. NBEC-018 TaxID=2996004 RepID=UPI002175463B|nr:hypothetical protein [Brachybacterium sp. NBEC-018]UVY84296.1 hypothetical protein NLU66_01475 [Brachybacterium sp. NBEC-018]